MDIEDFILLITYHKQWLGGQDQEPPFDHRAPLLKKIDPLLLSKPIEEVYLYMLDKEPDKWNPEGYCEPELRHLDNVLKDMDSRTSIMNRKGYYKPSLGYFLSRGVELFAFSPDESGREIVFFDPLHQRLVDFPELIQPQFDPIAQTRTTVVPLYLHGNCLFCYSRVGS
ncbi:MAG: hypothetical protein GXP63_05645 [DPANN group archaeon]|nr:hypothetical protein [DPANN group archaeon]